MSESAREQFSKPIAMPVAEAPAVAATVAAWGGDDICPPWWPRRPPWPPRGPWATIARRPDLIAADGIYRSLTLLAMSVDFGDEALARDVRRVAVGHLRSTRKVLAGGAAASWDDDGGICPPWPWPWPWPQRRLGDEAIRDRTPAGGRALLDALRVLQAYTVAAAIEHDGARQAATGALGQALDQTLEEIGRTFAA